MMCKHHWIIDHNNLGACQKCPETRPFSKDQIGVITGWNP